MKRERLWLRIVGVSFVAALVAAACSGTGFSGDDGGGDGSSTGGEAGAGTSGASGTAGTSAGTGGGTTLCTDATQCEDFKACTLDICNDVGQCEHPPKCTGDEDHCCGGVCGQCCEPSDCNDDVDCTADDCFDGVCSNTPTPCMDDVNQYCSETGCKDREQCSVAADCDDAKPCTTDRCSGGLCAHDSCAAGLFCCADGSGCQACCGDSQCASPGDDPCNPAVCNDGVCGHEELCQATSQICCARANGSADCGVGCCTNDDCEDIPCTRKLCTPNGCRNDPIAGDCQPGEVCEVGTGCVPVAQCSASTPCPPPADPCQEVRCTNGHCDYSSACRNGTTCCPGVGCRECCSNTECTSGGAAGPYCCSDNKCGQCCTAQECGNQLNSPKIITPAGSLPTTGGSSCTISECLPDHTCGPGAITTCREPLICCPGIGCISQFECSAI